MQQLKKINGLFISGEGGSAPAAGRKSVLMDYFTREAVQCWGDPVMSPCGGHLIPGAVPLYKSPWW